MLAAPAPPPVHPNVLREMRLMDKEEMEALAEIVASEHRVRSETAFHADMAHFRTHPEDYCRQRLNVRLTPDQREMFQSLIDNRFTVIKASHAVGKTYWAAMAMNWWFDCWHQHIGYVTGPTWDQALGLTFKQAAKMRRENNLPGRIIDGRGLVRDEDDVAAVGHFFRALNAERGEGFQGEHTSDVLVVFEEGVGVPSYIWEAGRGLMTSPGCRMLAIGNPTDASTKFGEVCEESTWNVMSIAALDHPNIIAEMRGERQPFPHAVGLLWLVEMLETECEVSPTIEEDAFRYWRADLIRQCLDGKYTIPDADAYAAAAPDDPRLCWYRPTSYFQSRALGEFPSVPDEQVIPSAWLKNLPVIPDAMLYGIMPEIGCDVARMGIDRTTIIPVWGGACLPYHVVRRMDNVAVTSRLKMAAIATALTCAVDPKAIPMKIDITGGLGTGPFDYLKSEGYNVYGVNSSLRAYDQATYPNRRSELWFLGREGFRTKTSDLSRLAPTAYRLLCKELSLPHWKPDKAGRKVVEDKAEIKKRLGYSPDLADGYNLARTSPLVLGGQLRAVPNLSDFQTPIEKRDDERQQMESDARQNLPKDIADHVLGLLGG